MVRRLAKLTRPPRPDGDLQGLHTALEQEVLGRIQSALPALTVGFLVWFIFQLLLLPDAALRVLPWMNLAGVGSFLLLNFLFRRKRIQSRRAHQVGSAIAVVILLNALVSVYCLSEPYLVATLALLFIALGNTFLSRRWLISVLACGLLSWGVTAWLSFSGSQQMVFGLILLAAAGTGLTFQQRRLANAIRRHQAHLLNEERRQGQERAEKGYRLAVRGSKDGLWSWDLRTGEFQPSPRWAEMIGHGPDEVSSSPDEWFDRVHPYYLAELKDNLSAHLYGKTAQFQSEYRLRTRDGSYLWVLCRGVAERDEHGNATVIAGTQTDITRLMEVEKRLVNDAFHDKLTGLPNRHYFLGQLETAVERMKRGSSDLFAVIFLDLDRFKVINDSLGHLVGDQLLAAVAGRLRSTQRQRDTVARFGGDEFVILLQDLHEPEEALHVGRRINEVLARPFQLGEHEVMSGGSIGIALSNTGVEKTEDLLRNADTAMYYAKSQRRGQPKMFTTDMHSRALRLWELQNDLGRALERNELILEYQPLISLRTGRIKGVEALVRWQRGKELIAPNDFIPLAEETGVIADLGEWVLRTACQQNKAWQNAGLRSLRMAVNLSARELQNKGFPDTVTKVLETTRLDSRYLELELTETALMDSLDVAPASLEALSRKGIRLSIDDFGTGYSSLSYLRRFAFNNLKIDRSFVADLTRDKKAAAVAGGLIALAHELELKVTAEGVETPDQLSFLQRHRCDQMQGFLAGRPVAPEEFARLLKQDPRLIPKLVTESPVDGVAGASSKPRSSEKDLVISLPTASPDGGTETDSPGGLRWLAENVARSV